MATAKQIRDAMRRCADRAAQEYPDDRNMRARTFVARLCGSMEAAGDAATVSVLDRVLGIDAHRPAADGA